MGKSLIFFGALILVGFLYQPAFGQLKGDYEKIGNIPAAHSVDTVLFEEYLNFTCPHCNKFRKASGPIFKKYGNKIKRVNIPILFRGQSEFPLRLYFVAERKGKGEEIKHAIFDAAFKSGVNIYDPGVIGFIARSKGLGDEYRKGLNADWVNAKVAESKSKSTAAGITGTPTVVLQGSLKVSPKGGMNAFVGNLDNLIGQLLKK